DPHAEKVGNEELENWLVRGLSPRIDLRFFTEEIDGKPIVLLEVPRAHHTPVQFKSQEFIRVGSIKQPLKNHPQIERQLWRTFDNTPFERLIARSGLTGEEVDQLLDTSAYFRWLDRPRPD